jgi:hypothetical protein
MFCRSETILEGTSFGRSSIYSGSGTRALTLLRPSAIGFQLELLPPFSTFDHLRSIIGTNQLYEREPMNVSHRFVDPVSVELFLVYVHSQSLGSLIILIHTQTHVISFHGGCCRTFPNRQALRRVMDWGRLQSDCIESNHSNISFRFHCFDVSVGRASSGLIQIGVPGEHPTQGVRRLRHQRAG